GAGDAPEYRGHRAQNPASLRLLERRGFAARPLADTGEAHYTLSLGERPIPIPGAARHFLHAPNYVHPCAC
ncbi:MAG TPA: hypothetical protein VG123_25335, partial [Streptosporangiaceae bacterium]|nr:hypothetical protein [Streptosporangiaceae bacterium]